MFQATNVFDNDKEQSINTNNHHLSKEIFLSNYTNLVLMFS